MKYLFINLENATDRRAFVERNFGECSDRSIYCVPAVDIASVEARGIEGDVRAGEKACYLSHLKALRTSLAHEEDVLIAEDDVLFSKYSIGIIDNTRANLEESGWDIIFSDLCIPGIMAMLNFFFLARKARKNSEHYYMEIKGDFQFAGATSYIVHRNAKRKILDLMERERIDRPYDLALRDLIAMGKLKAYVIVPFATSLSKLGDSSQIQADSVAATEFVWNSFRRLVWQGRDMAAMLEDSRRLDAEFQNDENEVFSRVLKAALSEGFGQK
ncbi:MAG: hypothetical protein JWO51_1341 [Rhodospirillales bacterium]|nr:hypothetical protein [Rhodospirillales bacterium]